jgi:hypothetical protein
MLVAHETRSLRKAAGHSVGVQHRTQARPAYLKRPGLHFLTAEQENAFIERGSLPAPEPGLRRSSPRRGRRSIRVSLSRDHERRARPTSAGVSDLLVGGSLMMRFPTEPLPGIARLSLDLAWQRWAARVHADMTIRAMTS